MARLKRKLTHLGIANVRTLVQDDLKGRIWFTNAGGARVVITVPRPAAA